MTFPFEHRGQHDRPLPPRLCLPPLGLHAAGCECPPQPRRPQPDEPYDAGGNVIDFEWLCDRTQEYALAAVDGRSAAVAQELTTVAERHGNYGVYLLCCGLANAVAEMAGYPVRQAGTPAAEQLEPYGFAMIDLDTGEQVSPESEAGMRARDLTAAYRFLMAYLNDDHDLLSDLFLAGLQNERQAMMIPAGLAHLVAAWGRRRLAEAGG